MRKVPYTLIVAMALMGIIVFKVTAPSANATHQQQATTRIADIATKIGDCERGGHIANRATGDCTNMELPALTR